VTTTPKYVCCTLTAAVLWPIAGYVLLRHDEIDFPSYLAGIVYGPFAAYILACDVAANQNVLGQFTLPADCKKVDAETFYCDQPFTVNMGAFGGSFDLVAVDAQPDGPVFSGAVSGISEWLNPQLSITSVKTLVNDPTTMMLTWAVAGSCATGFVAQASGYVSCGNAIKGFSKLKICHAGPLSASDDPSHCFGVTTPGSVNVALRPWKADGYLADPYSWSLLIVTNGGVRIMTVAAVKQITDQEVQELKKQEDLAADLCHRLQLGPQRWQFPPEPDPDPIGQEIAQIWELVVAGLGPMEFIELIGRQGQVLATGLANHRGVAEASYWAEGALRLDEIGIKINSSGGHPTRNDAGWHVSGRQSRLELRSRIAIRDTFQSVLITRPEDQTLLSIQTATTRAVYDISAPGLPSLQSTEMITAMARARVETSDMEEFAHGTAVDMVGVKQAVYIHGRDGVARVVNLSDPKNPKEVGTYFSTPWFVDSARSGRTCRSTNSRRSLPRKSSRDRSGAERCELVDDAVLGHHRASSISAGLAEQGVGTPSNGVPTDLLGGSAWCGWVRL
jgi:hypothetical protein